MLEIQQQIINYNKSARSSEPIYIVVHDTGDAGATAKNEHDYFSGGDRQASADFFVDSNNIIQIIDTDVYYSWHCGDGGGKYGISNRNSLGIEMCLESNEQPSDTTVNNTLDLVRYLMSKYNIGIENVVRHYDASRKNCPASFNTDGNWTKWNEFKNRLSNNSSYNQGWNQSKYNSKWFYYTDTDGNYYKNQWSKIDGYWFHFDSDGYMQTNWLNDNGDWFYLNPNSDGSLGRMLTGWIKYKDKWCYLEEQQNGNQGMLYIDCKATINNKTYNFDKDGYMI
jgi:N-acetylmuramoyl-L-alanine amidase